MPTLPCATLSRYSDTSPWFGGDYLWYTGPGYCSSGFEIYATNHNGTPSVLTTAHCGINHFYNSTFAGAKGPQIGTTWDRVETSAGCTEPACYDIQDLSPATGTQFAHGYIYGGAAGSTSPPLYTQGGALVGFPTSGDTVYYDGAKSGEHHVTVEFADPQNCLDFHNPTGGPNIHVCNLITTSLHDSNNQIVNQGGDSGGALLGKWFSGVVTPVGVIEGSCVNCNESYSSLIGPDLSEMNAVISGP